MDRTEAMDMADVEGTEDVEGMEDVEVMGDEEGTKAVVAARGADMANVMWAKKKTMTFLKTTKSN